MIDFWSFVRQSRLDLAMTQTQTQLAYRAKVSLPTIQNLESGKANPSLNVMSSILSILGCSLEIQRSTVDWEVLIASGAPLLSTRKSPLRLKRNADVLAQTALAACLELANGEKNAGHQRKADALRALFWGMKLHFPSVFKAKFSRSPAVQALVAGPLRGRDIKLIRHSVAVLSTYL